MRARAAEIEAVLADAEAALQQQAQQNNAALMMGYSPRFRHADAHKARAQQSPAEVAWEIAEFESRLQVRGLQGFAP